MPCQYYLLNVSLEFLSLRKKLFLVPKETRWYKVMRQGRTIHAQNVSLIFWLEILMRHIFLLAQNLPALREVKFVLILYLNTIPWNFIACPWKGMACRKIHIHYDMMIVLIFIEHTGHRGFMTSSSLPLCTNLVQYSCFAKLDVPFWGFHLALHRLSKLIYTLFELDVVPVLSKDSVVLFQFLLFSILITFSINSQGNLYTLTYQHDIIDTDWSPLWFLHRLMSLFQIPMEKLLLYDV